ncbi:hypothetical protein L3X38_036759 [Prunus dulcis]|uniref:Uncharacterized protein n=1 Tax=Prunus dulcis TaxID=3755 RepID=A0AAD4V3U3_PRUDU|nr:hypothetical protein L3X38_036759 [Prunus dulcis]
MSPSSSTNANQADSDGSWEYAPDYPRSPPPLPLPTSSAGEEDFDDLAVEINYMKNKQEYNSSLVHYWTQKFRMPQNAQDDGIFILAVENLMNPHHISDLPYKGTKETEVILGPINDEPISKLATQSNLFSDFSSEPKPFSNIKSFSEPGPILGIEKDKETDPQSKSECTMTKLKLKLIFLSRFGRANGEGSKGLRKGLSHIDDRLSNPDASMQVSSLSPTAITEKDDDESIRQFARNHWIQWSNYHRLTLNSLMKYLRTRRRNIQKFLPMKRTFLMQFLLFATNPAVSTGMWKVVSPPMSCQMRFWG